MNFDTLGEPDNGLPPSRPRKKRGVGGNDALRWELMMLLSIHNTQERYVALLRANDTIDPTYLASEETYLAELERRVRQARFALGTDR